MEEHSKSVDYILPKSSNNLACWGLFLLAILVYWPAREAGFVTDWLGGQAKYEQGTYADVFNNFGWRALVPVLYFVNFSMFKVFGTWWAAWFVLFTGLHAANAWQMLRFVRRLEGLPARNAVSAVAALLFLLSPYAAESVVWKACVQYELALLICWVVLHKVLDYTLLPSYELVIQIAVLYLIGIYLTEWTVVTPLLTTWLIFTLALQEGRWRVALERWLLLAVPSFGLLAFWLFVNYQVYGALVGHDGAGTHLNFDVRLIFSTMMKYLVKFGLFARYLEGPKKDLAFGFFNAENVLWASAIVLVALALCWVVFFKRLSPALRWSGFALGCFFVALLPVANLFFTELLWSENDRHGYYASAFFWLAIVLLLSRLPRRIFGLVWVPLIAISGLLLYKTTQTWGDSERVYAGLLHDFRWYDKEEVIILASPENMRGIYMMRIIGQPNGFQEALALKRRAPYTGKMWEAVQFNMTGPNDGIKVEQLPGNEGKSYKIMFMQDGNWFWRNGIGASDYETERFKFEKKEWHAELHLKEKKPGTVLIYPVGSRWAEIGL